MGRAELYATALFSSGGRAVATSEPVPWGQSWRLSSIAVRTTSTSATSAAVYRNSELESNLLDLTLTRGNGAATDTPVELATGERLVCVWEGGSSGARADLTAAGEVA